MENIQSHLKKHPNNRRSIYYSQKLVNDEHGKEKIKTVEMQSKYQSKEFTH